MQKVERVNSSVSIKTLQFHQGDFSVLEEVNRSLRKRGWGSFDFTKKRKNNIVGIRDLTTDAQVDVLVSSPDGNIEDFESVARGVIRKRDELAGDPSKSRMEVEQGWRSYIEEVIQEFIKRERLNEFLKSHI